MILFETEASVFEVLWDIALAIFVVRTAFVYFALVFVTGCILGFSREAQLIPAYHVYGHEAEPIELPLMVMMIMLWARFTMIQYEIPKAAGWALLRFAIGLVALGFMLLAELLATVVTHYAGWRSWVGETESSIAIATFVACLAFFALCPVLLILVENEVDILAKTLHGHEKKVLSDAVPLITKSKKGARESIKKVN